MMSFQGWGKLADIQESEYHTYCRTKNRQLKRNKLLRSKLKRQKIVDVTRKRKKENNMLKTKLMKKYAEKFGGEFVKIKGRWYFNGLLVRTAWLIQELRKDKSILPEVWKSSENYSC